MKSSESEPDICDELEVGTPACAEAASRKSRTKRDSNMTWTLGR